MLIMKRKQHPLPEHFEDYRVSQANLHLGEWFIGIYNELDENQKVAWLEFLVLATHFGGQINYISNDQLSTLLSIEKSVFEEVLSNGLERGKILSFDKLIVPAKVSRVAPIIRTQAELGTKASVEVELTWTKPCAVYKTLLFPGAFDYFRERPMLEKEYAASKPPFISDDPQGLKDMLKDARDRMRIRLETSSFIIPSRQLYREMPFRLCQPLNLTQPFYVFDEALGDLDAQMLNELDCASCTWDLDPQVEFSQQGGGILSTRWYVFHRIDNFVESSPSPIPWRIYPEDILRPIEPEDKN